MLKNTIETFTLIITIGIGSAASADTLTFGTDLEFGLEDGGSAITATPSLEYANAFGFYVGAEASNVDSDADSVSTTAYVGYSGEAGLFSYDLYYGRSYLNNTGDDGQEANLSIGYPVAEGLTMATSFITDLEDAQSMEQSFAYPIASYEISGAYEFADGDGENAWELGVSKTLTDTVSLDWRYYDSQAEDEQSFAMTVSYATDLAHLIGM